MSFIIFKKFELKEAIEVMETVEKWFRNNPEKKICKTDRFVIKKEVRYHQKLKVQVAKKKYLIEYYLIFLLP